MDRRGGLLRANRKENRQINFRVSEDEYQRLEQMATDVGLSVPTFCKKKAHGAKVRAPKIDREGAMEIARQLRAMGNNLNQLTKRANEGVAIPSGELQGMQKELQVIWQQFSEALQK